MESKLELKTQEEWKCLEFTWLKAKCFQGPWGSENIWNISSGPEFPECQFAAWTAHHPLAFYASVPLREAACFFIYMETQSRKTAALNCGTLIVHITLGLWQEMSLAPKITLTTGLRFSHNWRVLRERIKCMRADGHLISLYSTIWTSFVVTLVMAAKA